jgi:hypothetical protein
MSRSNQGRWMIRERVTGVVALTAALAIASALAAAPALAGGPRQFLANLNASQETPPNASNAFGVAHFTFDDTTLMLCFSIAYSGLGSSEISAHIHGPGLPGVPAGILFTLPAGSPKSGCAGPLTSDQKKALLKNELYTNVHTTGFSGGEIRGQILRIK